MNATKKARVITATKDAPAPEIRSLRKSHLETATPSDARPVSAIKNAKMTPGGKAELRSGVITRIHSSAGLGEPARTRSVSAAPVEAAATVAAIDRPENLNSSSARSLNKRRRTVKTGELHVNGRLEGRSAPVVRRNADPPGAGAKVRILEGS